MFNIDPVSEGWILCLFLLAFVIYVLVDENPVSYTIALIGILGVIWNILSEGY